MSINRFVIPLLLFCSSLGAQVETIIADGKYGFSFDFEYDTLIISKVDRGTAADSLGIQEKDKVMYINGIKVSGADLNGEELDQYFSGRAGSEINIKILRAGSDSLINYSFIRYFSREIWPDCLYDYLLDSTNKITPDQLFADTTGIQFSSVIDNGIRIHSLVQDSAAGILDIQAGDQFLSFDHGIYSWVKLWFKEYRDADTIIRILRDSAAFDLHADLREYPELQINSLLAQDLKEESIWLRVIFTKRLVEDKTMLIRWFDHYDSIFLYQRSFDGSIRKKGPDMRCPIKNGNLFLKTIRY